MRGNGQKINVGQYKIRELSDGSFYIERDNGKGTQVSHASFEALIMHFIRIAKETKSRLK